MGFLDRFRQPRQETAPQRSAPPNFHFAVVDIETSGLSPVADRIIEIGVVIMDASGQVLHEWETLVNPGDRKAGATSIHGIQADWLAAAPTFGEIAGDLTERLVGRVVVAHNVKFDLEFIEGEFRRLGHPIRSDLGYACTMDLANQMGLPRKLQRLAGELGLPYYPHGALDDARVTAQVLTRFLRYIDNASLAGAVLAPGSFPASPPSGKVMHRKEAGTLTKPQSFLSDLIQELPPFDVDKTHDPEAAAAYLTILEEVMEDGYISPEEREKLISTAQTWGLSRDEADLLHREFLDVLLDAALADRTLSKDEREQIQKVAIWLGVEAGDLDLLIRQARARGRAQVDDARAEMKGRVVTFTGRGIYSNSIREGFCAKYGIVFTTSVGATCDLLVIGSDEVENATVAKARERGIPMMVERAFWYRLGEKVPKVD
ncbi:MAG: exonuclease domain-containing protein [Actinomycetota bacterium]